LAWGYIHFGCILDKDGRIHIYNRIGQLTKWNLEDSLGYITEEIFKGGIHWMGKGEVSFPLNMGDESTFQKTLKKNIVYPKNGFVNVFMDGLDPTTGQEKYNAAWLSIQNLEKGVYLKDKKNNAIHLFLYRPSVGIGNPADCGIG